MKRTEIHEVGTDKLHRAMADAVRELPETHLVRLIWERLDWILENGGPECLPAPWDAAPEWVDLGAEAPTQGAMSSDAASTRISAQDLITRLGKERRTLQVWVEAPDSPEGFLPLDGRAYTVDDPEPAAGDPRQCLVLALSR